MNEEGSKGMSRAAQKKRKRQQKLNQSQIGDLQLPSVGDHDHDNSERETHSDAEDESGARKRLTTTGATTTTTTATSTHRRKGGWKIFSREPVGHPLLHSLSTQTLPQLLQLRDVYDAVAAEKAALLLSKIVFPQSREDFFESVWEKQPALFAHGESGFFGKIFTKKALKTLLCEHVLALGKEVEEYDAAGVSLSPSAAEDENDDDNNNNAESETRTVSGGELWTRISREKHALRLLQPQVYHDPCWELCAALEHEFGCRVAAEITAQPAEHSLSLSARPVDQFVLQLEGSAQWTLQRSQGEREKDNEKESSGGEDKVFSLDAGDSLYVPAGCAVRVLNTHTSDLSLSLSLVTSNTNSVGRFLQLAVPQAVDNLVSENRAFRRLMPANVRSYLGVAVSETESPQRQALLEDLSKMLTQVMAETMEIADAAHDQLSKQFIAERLPVPLTPTEEAQTVAGAPHATIYPYTQLRVVRPGIAIAVVEEGKVVVYHAMDNSRELFGAPLNPLEFELDDGPAIEALLNAYPSPVVVQELEHSSEDLEDKIGIAEALYKEGILMIVDEASKPVDENNSDEDSDSPF